MNEIEQELRDIEQRFFETFEIPKSQNCIYAKWDEHLDSWYCNRDGKGCWTYPDNVNCGVRDFPEITDRVLLELYVIYSHFPNVVLQVGFEDVEDLKKHLLTTFILEGKAFKKEVQALFKEAE